MKFECLFVQRNEIRSGQYAIELVAAWDEHVIQKHPKGWEDDMKDSLMALQEDYRTSRLMVVNIPDSALEKAFKSCTVGAKILVSQELVIEDESVELDEIIEDKPEQAVEIIEPEESQVVEKQPLEG